MELGLFLVYTIMVVSCMEVVMSLRSQWLGSLEDKSLSELFSLLDEEKEAMRDLKNDRPYEGRADQILSTRENINTIWEAIHSKQGR